jgi:carbonic anhydrase
MCHLCEVQTSGHLPGRISRRQVLGLFGAAAASAALPGMAFARTKAPPKPQNAVTADQALELLRQGNQRYVSGVSKRHDFTHEREALVGGQNPYAAILSCADSRIAPEYAFDSARGDLFVGRVAGNFLTDEMIASFEYAAAVLKTPLFVVLGHDSCGAVSATIKSLAENSTLPGHLPSLVTNLAPAVQGAKGRPGDAVDNAIRENVALNVAKLRSATPIMSDLVSAGKIRVIGALYHLKDGKVEFV